MKKFLIIGFVLAFILSSCYKKPIPEHFGNQPPETYISNIIIADSTGDTAVADTSALPYVSVYVYGYDGDGKISAFQWAVDDTSQDSTIYESGWHTDSIGEADGEKAVITFPASRLDTFYQHILYVRAVDNNFLADPTPAMLKLFVKNNYLPHPSIVPSIYEGGDYWVESSNDTEDLYILYDAQGDTGLDTTSYWKGISFRWTAIDSDAVSPLMFKYRWDNDSFCSWTYDTAKMFITAAIGSVATRSDSSDTILKYNGLHRFQLIARDDAFAVSKDTATVYLRTYKKTFNGKILLVDGTGKIPYTTDAAVDSFYHMLLDTVSYVDWDNSDGTNPLTMEALAPYSTIVFYMDGPLQAGSQFFNSSAVIFKFLSAGGSMILIGSQIYSSLPGCIDVSAERDTVYKNYYFGVRDYLKNTAADFITALSISDSVAYPTMEYDSTILHNASFEPGMKNVGIFEKLTAHSRGIYGFDSYTANVEFQGKPCAVENTGPDGGFRVVFFDFPFYFMKTDNAGEPLKTAMQSAIKFVRGSTPQ